MIDGPVLTDCVVIRERESEREKERVRENLPGDARVRVHLLQHLVDVRAEGLHALLAALRLVAALLRRLCGLGGGLGLVNVRKRAAGPRSVREG